MIRIIRLRHSIRYLFVLWDSLLTVNVLLFNFICNGLRIFIGLVKLGSVLVWLLFLILILAIINVTLTIVLELATWVILQRSQVPRRSSTPKLLVIDLSLIKLLLVFGNRHVHHFNFLALLVLETLFEAASVTHVLVTLHQLDLLLQLVIFLMHLIDTLDKINVVFHEASIIFSALLQVTRDLAAIVANMFLMNPTLLKVRLARIEVRRLAVVLIKYPRFVKANNTLLQPLVVLDMLHYLEDVVLEALLPHQLKVYFVPATQEFIFETLVLHSQIINDQIQVVTDPVEMLDFDLHLVNLLMQARNIVLTRQNISLQFFNFVIKNEFEFLKFLSLLLQLHDASIFVLDSGFAGLQLSFLGLNLASQLIDRNVEGARLA